MNDLKLVAAIILLFVGLFWNKISPDIPVIPDMPSYVEILKLQKPTDAVLNETNELQTILSNGSTQDKEIIGIFHNELSRRIPSYNNVSVGDFENFYYEVAKNVYGEQLRGKYPALGAKMYALIVGVLGDDDGTITTVEMNKLADNMKGIAWSLLGG